jgi:hypothetical protein
MYDFWIRVSGMNTRVRIWLLFHDFPSLVYPKISYRAFLPAWVNTGVLNCIYTCQYF